MELNCEIAPIFKSAPGRTTFMCRAILKVVVPSPLKESAPIRRIRASQHAAAASPKASATMPRKHLDHDHYRVHLSIALLITAKIRLSLS